MRNLLILLAAVTLSSIVVPAIAQKPPADQPATSFPYTPGLDVNAMDKTANACVDFYQYT